MPNEITEAPAAAPITEGTKPSLADEFLAAFKAETKPTAGAEPPPETAAKVESKAEGDKVETIAEEAKEERETGEAPKPVEKPTSLARRLAMVAQAERTRKANDEAAAKAKAEQEARDKEIAPIIERITKAKGAKSKMEAAATVLGLDDEGIAELYLELHQHQLDEKKPADPMANLEATVAKLLDAKLSERDAAQKASAEKALNSQREAYTAETIGILEARGDEFPLVAIAPPSQVDITAISEAWLVANGEIPEPEVVLSLIQSERQKALDERNARKAKPAEKKIEGAARRAGRRQKPRATTLR
jgi:hypothetical protein